MNEVSLSVLGYVEDGDWIAHALEFDIVGVGETFEQAIEALQEAIELQMSYAHFKEDPSLIFHRAPEKLFEQYQKAKDEALFQQIAKCQVEEGIDRIRAGGIPIPSFIDEKGYAFA